MDFEQAERRFRELERQRRSGHLDDTGFHVEVAKLLLRDEQGVFWMLDADSGAWFCNPGEDWVPGDPRASRPPQHAPPVERPARRRGASRLLILGAILIVATAGVGILALKQGWIGAWNRPAATPAGSTDVRVSIASPANGSQVALGHLVAIESTVHASPDLQAVAHVELQANGQMVESQLVRPRIQPGQQSLPLSQLWQPKIVGEQQIVVTAFSDDGSALAQATVTLHVAETADLALPEPACIRDAAFVADVTIPPGAAFPPGVRMDKVWQVHNSGTCAWGVGYDLVRLEGDELGAPEAVSIPPTSAGEQADLTVTFWAPAEVGAYASLWQLRSPDGQLFGPTLPLTIQVEILAEQNLPPIPPAGLRASVVQDNKAIQLAWLDRSDNEDAFRIYRQDVEASIGLVAADVELFVDRGVSCGRTYRYAVVAFNAAGSSPVSETVEVTLPACTPTDEPPPGTVMPGPFSHLLSWAGSLSARASVVAAFGLAGPGGYNRYRTIRSWRGAGSSKQK